jgi:hypothetical protein
MIDNQWNSCETYEFQRGEFTGTSLNEPADTFITMLRVTDPFTLAKGSGIRKLYHRQIMMMG